MKSKTSLINKTVFKKDITRFAPIWGGYTIFILLCLFLLTDYDAPIIAVNVEESLLPMAFLNMLYAGICGAFLFMDLFNGRLCNALHAFPIRRESWLVTHIASGILFSVVPNLLIALIGSIYLWNYAYMALIWLAISTLQYLFFFGTAVLAAMCAGNLLGMTAVYGIIHFITLLVFRVVELFYEPLLYGVKLNSTIAQELFPIAKLIQLDYVLADVSHLINRPQFAYKGLLGKSWLYVGLCAAAGIVSLVLAWRVYRRRQLEVAGDFISLRWLSPVFLVFCAIGAGAVLYLFSGRLDGMGYVFLLVGLAIGYFAGRMLLGRTLKVFGKKSLISFGVLVAVLAGSYLLTWLDPIGVTRYVPALDKIESAAVIGADRGHYFYAANGLIPSYVDTRNDSDGFRITDPQELTELQDFHQELIRYRPGSNEGITCDVMIVYTLESGRTVTRYYEVGRNTALGDRAGEYFNDMRYIFDVDDTTVLQGAFEAVSINYYADKVSTQIKIINQAEIAGLLDAIQADCNAGVMAQNYAYHNAYGMGDEKYNSENYYIVFSVDDSALDKDGWSIRSFQLEVYPDSTNTLAYLKDMLTLYGEQE